MYRGLSYVKLIFFYKDGERFVTMTTTTKTSQIIELYNKLIAEHGSETLKSMALADDFQDKLKALTGKGKKERKTKTTKDPNKPKKPTTTWLLFCKDERDAMKQKHPTAKMSEISSLLSPLWADLQAATDASSIARVDKYKAVVEEQRAAYKEAMASYTGSSDDGSASDNSTTSKKKKAKKEPKPKKEAKPPKSGYQLFMKQERAKPKPEGETFGETTKRISAMWKELKETDPERVEQICAEAKAGLVKPVEETKGDDQEHTDEEDDTRSVDEEGQGPDDPDAILEDPSEDIEEVLTKLVEEEEMQPEVDTTKKVQAPKKHRRPRCVKKQAS